MAYYYASWLSLSDQSLIDIQVYGFILFPCLLILLVLDIALNHLSTSTKHLPSPSQASSPMMESTKGAHLLPADTRKTRRIITIDNCQTLIQTSHPRRVATWSSSKDNPSRLPRPCPGRDPRPSKAFISFCERLIHANKVWQRERELSALQAKLARQKRATHANAFAAFRDRLLLQNRVWAKERELLEMRHTCMELQRARDAAVTRAAEAMVDDLRREALARDLVVGILGELHDARQALKDVQKAHEQEILQIHGEWSKDYRKVSREVELLRLGHESRMVEQDVATHSEEALVESLRVSQEREAQLSECLRAMRRTSQGTSPHSELEDVPSVHDAYLTSLHTSIQEGGVDDDSDNDSLNDISISSTCVSTQSLPLPKIPYTSIPTPLPTPVIDGIGRSLSPTHLHLQLSEININTAKHAAWKSPTHKRKPLVLIPSSVWARATGGARKSRPATRRSTSSAAKAVVSSKKQYHVLCGSPTSSSESSARPFSTALSATKRMKLGIWRP